MKFQNPSFTFFLNGRTNGQTNKQTDKPKAICSPLFKVGGTKRWANTGPNSVANSFRTLGWSSSGPKAFKGSDLSVILLLLP